MPRELRQQPLKDGLLLGEDGLVLVGIRAHAETYLRRDPAPRLTRRTLIAGLRLEHHHIARSERERTEVERKLLRVIARLLGATQHLTRRSALLTLELPAPGNLHEAVVVRRMDAQVDLVGGPHLLIALRPQEGDHGRLVRDHRDLSVHRVEASILRRPNPNPIVARTEHRERGRKTLTRHRRGDLLPARLVGHREVDLGGRNKQAAAHRHARTGHRIDVAVRPLERLPRKSRVGRRLDREVERRNQRLGKGRRQRALCRSRHHPTKRRRKPRRRERERKPHQRDRRRHQQRRRPKPNRRRSTLHQRRNSNELCFNTKLQRRCERLTLRLGGRTSRKVEQGPEVGPQLRKGPLQQPRQRMVFAEGTTPSKQRDNGRDNTGK